MFASSGLMTPPCGVPRVLRFPPVMRRPPRSSCSSMGVFSHILRRCSTCRSTTRRATLCNNSWCGMVSKYFDRSASTTSVYPSHSASCTTRTASCALRFGRYPYALSSKSASKIGSSISLTAVCTTRSRIVGIPSGRSPPSGFGIETRRRGSGRSVSSCSPLRTPASHSSTPAASMFSNLKVVGKAGRLRRWTRGRSDQGQGLAFHRQIDLDVHLGRLHIDVAEKILDRDQWHAGLEQVHGLRVSKGVRTDATTVQTRHGRAGAPEALHQQIACAMACESIASTIGDERGVVIGAASRMRQEVRHEPSRLWEQRTQPFTTALALDADERRG